MCTVRVSGIVTSCIPAGSFYLQTFSNFVQNYLITRYLDDKFVFNLNSRLCVVRQSVQTSAVCSS